MTSQVPGRLTCPACGMTSHNPADAAEGYCGMCRRYLTPLERQFGDFVRGFQELARAGLLSLARLSRVLADSPAVRGSAREKPPE